MIARMLSLSWGKSAAVLVYSSDYSLIIIYNDFDIEMITVINSSLFQLEEGVSQTTTGRDAEVVLLLEQTHQEVIELSVLS